MTKRVNPMHRHGDGLPCTACVEWWPEVVPLCRHGHPPALCLADASCDGPESSEPLDEFLARKIAESDALQRGAR